MNIRSSLFGSVDSMFSTEPNASNVEASATKRVLWLVD